MIAAFGFTKFDRREIDMREHGKAHLNLVFPEKLRLQVDRQVADFFLGKNGFLNFFLSCLSWIFCGTRGVIPAPSLNVDVRFAGQRDFQGVKTAIEFQVLRRETKEIGGYRSSHSFAQCDVNVIAVVIKGATGSVGEVTEDFFLRELRLHAVVGLVACGPVGIYRRTGNVAAEGGGIESAGIQGVDDDASTICAVNDVHPLLQKSGKNESRRDENQFSLARHGAEPSQGIFDVAIGVIRSYIAAVYGSRGCA